MSMPESSPDEQPTLPLFPDQTVSFYVDSGDPAVPMHETVTVPVDQIEGLEDPRMRKALWEQFVSASDPNNNWAVVVIGGKGGKFLRAVELPRRSISERFRDTAHENASYEELGQSSPDSSLALPRKGFMHFLFRR